MSEIQYYSSDLDYDGADFRNVEGLFREGTAVGDALHAARTRLGIRAFSGPVCLEYMLAKAKLFPHTATPVTRNGIIGCVAQAETIVRDAQQVY